MEELLQRLLESELLTEDTKEELTEAVTQIKEANKEALDVAIVEATAYAEAKVQVQLQEQYQIDKAKLVEALDTKVTEHLENEIGELKDDIARFRDLEVEYAEKLEEAKEELNQVLKGDIEELVETIDSFLDMRLTEEINELKEDIDLTKRLQFGAEIYEAVEVMFSKKFVDENGLKDSLKENKERLEDVTKKLEEASTELDDVKREKKMDEVLEALHGRSRDVMEAVLKNHPTDKLEEAYEHYIPKILHENAIGDVESEKETSTDGVLAEGDTTKIDETDKSNSDKVVVAEGTVVTTGNTEALIEESAEQLPPEVLETLARLKHLGGVGDQYT